MAMAVVTGRFVFIRSLDITWVELVVIYPLFLGLAIVLGYIGAKLFSWTRGVSTSAQSETIQRDWCVGFI